MTSQLVVGPHSSSSLIKSNSSFTVDNITTNGLNIGSTISINGDLNVTGEYQLNGETVLIGNTLGSGITISNLEQVGDLESLNIIGDLNVDSTTLVVDSSNNNVGISTTPNSSFALDVNGPVNITGDLIVQGITALNGVTTIVSTTTAINDTFLKLAITNPTDVVDTGVYNMYQDGGVTKFAGYFRDATDKTFKFFENLEIEPSTIVDISTTSFQLADILVDNIEASTLNISTTSIINQLSVSGNADFSNVGIGTTSFSYPLNVSGDINTESGVYRVNGNEVLNGNSLGNGITSSNLQEVGILNSLNVTGDLLVDTNSFYVNSSNGRVGIGTTAPGFDLVVVGDINQTGILYNNGNEVINGNTLGNSITSSNLQELGILNSLNVTGNVNLDGNTLFVDSSNNRVGIGTTTPEQSLHILDDSIVNELQLKIENISSLGNAGLEIDNNGTGNLTIKQNDNASIFSNDGGDMLFLSRDTGNIKFFTTDSNTRRMNIQNDGNIAIGLSNSANFNLDVDDSINTGIAYYITGVRKMDIDGVTSSTYHFNENTRIEEIGDLINVSVSGTQTRFDTNGNLLIFDGNLAVGITSPSLPITIGVTNTGLGTSGSELGLYTVGFERVRIDNQGLVGVGNLNPLFNLDVFGSINFTGQLFQNGTLFLNPDGLWTQNNGDVFLTGFGQVGIGVTTPTDKLHISDSINDTIGIRVDNEGTFANTLSQVQIETNAGTLRAITTGGSFITSGIFNPSTSYLVSSNTIGGLVIGTRTGTSLSFLTTDTVRMTITNTGNVGIGTTSPVSQLQVAGTLTTDFLDVGTLNVFTSLSLSGDLNMNNNDITNVNNITATNFIGTITTPSQTNITQVGTLINLDVTGDLNLDGGDLFVNDGSIVTEQNFSTNTPGGTYQIDFVTVLSQNTLGSGVINSSLENLGEQNSPLNMGSNNINNVATLNASDVIITDDLTVNGNSLYVNSANGNVGIGTTAPGFDLVVVGDINQTGILYNNGNEIINGNTLGSFVTNSSLQTVGILTSLNVTGDLLVDTNSLYVDSSTGNVGIGTTAPGFDLVVVGDINQTGILYNNGNEIINGNTLGSFVTNSSLQNLGTQNSDLNMGSNNITNIGTLTATTLNGTIGTASQPNITSLGTQSSDLNMGSNNITNIGTLTATTLNGTIGTASQPNITSVGTLNSLNINSSTEVGITTSIFNSLRLTSTDAIAGPQINFAYGSDIVRVGYISTGSAGTGVRLEAFEVVNNSTNGRINFTTNNTTSPEMSILKNGNVGIGATTPSDLLHIDSNTNASIGIRVDNRGTGILTESKICTETNAGSLDIITTGGSFTPTGIFTASASHIFSDVLNGMRIGTSNSSTINFFTDSTNYSRIASTGVQTIYSTAVAANPTFRVGKTATNTTNSVFIEFYRSTTSISSLGTLEGDIRLDGAGNLAFLDASDQRLKENITDYVNGYNKVKSLRTVEFEWKDQEKKENIGKVVGFIAQEVQDVLPKAVGTFEDNYLGINTKEMIPFMWSTLRTLINDKEKLEEENNSLKNKVNYLENFLTSLEMRVVNLENT